MKTKSNGKTALSTALSLLFIILSGESAQATESGTPTTAAGTYDFGAGFLPPATSLGTFGSRVAFYTAHTNRDKSGVKQNAPFSLQVLSLSLAWVKMTDQTLLGGRYGFGIIQPFFKMDMDMTARTPVGSLSLSDDTFRQADIQVLPLILGWMPSPNFAINTQFQIQAPTGDYDKNRLVNPGLNHWVYSPIVNASYITDSGFEVSSSLEVDFSTENRTTDYRNGIEYRYEYAVGQHVGSWTLGLGGYYYNQLTDDRVDGQGNGLRSRTFAWGPALNYSSRTGPSIWLHAYKETDSRNRSEGYSVAVRIAQIF